jgi:hypothetical protein
MELKLFPFKEAAKLTTFLNGTTGSCYHLLGDPIKLIGDELFQLIQG